MDFVKDVLLLVVVEDYDPAGIGADDDVVLLGAGEAELGEGPDGAEDFDGEDGLDSAVVVGAEEIQDLATSHHDLLGLAAGEAAVDGTHDAGGSLQSETVQIHGWLLLWTVATDSAKKEGLGF